MRRGSPGREGESSEKETWTNNEMIEMGGSLAGFFGFIWLIVLLVARRSGASRHWPSAPCTITGSAVRTETDSDSTIKRYGVNVEFDYTVAGQDYAGRRYKYSTTYEGKDASERIVAELAPGTRTVC